MTLTIDYDACKPLAIIIHPGSPHDTKIFDYMMNELKRRRILKKRQLILCDKGFYSL
jgi:transposase